MTIVVLNYLLKVVESPFVQGVPENNNFTLTPNYASFMNMSRKLSKISTIM